MPNAPRRKPPAPLVASEQAELVRLRQLEGLRRHQQRLNRRFQRLLRHPRASLFEESPSPGQRPRRYLLVPLPGPGQWSGSIALGQLCLGSAGLLREWQRGLALTAGVAQAEQDLRTARLLIQVAQILDAALEYQDAQLRPPAGTPPC